MAVGAVQSNPYANATWPAAIAMRAPAAVVAQPAASVDDTWTRTPEKPQTSAPDAKHLTDAYREGDKQKSWLTQKALKAIEWYQNRTRYVDEDGRVRNRLRVTCPYSPSCSTYTAEAIREDGVVMGILKGFNRLVFKCNPFTVRRELRKIGKEDLLNARDKTAVNGIIYDPVHRKTKALPGDPFAPPEASEPPEESPQLPQPMAQTQFQSQPQPQSSVMPFPLAAPQCPSPPRCPLVTATPIRRPLTFIRPLFPPSGPCITRSPRTTPLPPTVTAPHRLIPPPTAWPVSVTASLSS